MVPDTVPDRDRLQRVAEAITRRGWTLPALIAVDVGRPFAFLLGQAVWVAQPALALLWPVREIGQVARLLESPTAWDTLHHALTGASGNRSDE